MNVTRTERTAETQQQRESIRAEAEITTSRRHHKYVVIVIPIPHLSIKTA